MPRFAIRHSFVLLFLLSCASGNRSTHPFIAGGLAASAPDTDMPDAEAMAAQPAPITASTAAPAPAAQALPRDANAHSGGAHAPDLLTPVPQAHGPLANGFAAAMSAQRGAGSSSSSEDAAGDGRRGEGGVSGGDSVVRGRGGTSGGAAGGGGPNGSGAEVGKPQGGMPEGGGPEAMDVSDAEPLEGMCRCRCAAVI